MQQLRQDLLHAFCVGFVIPVTVLAVMNYVMAQKSVPSPEAAAQLADDIPEDNDSDSEIMYLREQDGRIRQTDMDTYLICALLGEMPASFPDEALKAQAVAARTFVYKAVETGGKHGDGSVCTDAECCQAYCPERSFLARGGSRTDGEKVASAVRETSGEVLTYGGELIEATYYACSGGRTEDALEVWGSDYPYLVSVDSPGEESAACFSNTVSFTAEEFQRVFHRSLAGAPEDWFGDCSYSAGGGVREIQICGESFSGTEVRRLLGLRSTMFTVTPDGQSIQFTTRGYGHRVGMSQYGAEAMADSGCSYREILAHYYPGTVLDNRKMLHNT